MTVRYVLTFVWPALLLLALSSAARSEIQQKPATSGAIAKLNLDHSLRRAERLRTAQPNNPAAAQGYVDLLLMRLQFYRDYADLDRLVDECERFSNDDRPAAQFLCSDVDAARHDFVSALSRIQHAVNRDDNCENGRRRIAAIAATLQLDTNIVQVEMSAATSTPENGSYQGSVVNAGIETAKGNVDAATSHYISAVKNYADVSPYPIAWAWYQVAELVKNSSPQTAIRYYEAALGYLPDYIAPRVELAALQLGLGQVQSAMTHLRFAAQRSNDPDIYGLLSQALQRAASNEADVAAAKHQLGKAEAGFAVLLARHPFAFADHAAEVYALTDPTRAMPLQAMLDQQKTDVQAQLENSAGPICPPS